MIKVVSQSDSPLEEIVHIFTHLVCFVKYILQHSEIRPVLFYYLKSNKGGG